MPSYGIVFSGGGALAVWEVGCYRAIRTHHGDALPATDPLSSHARTQHRGDLILARDERTVTEWAADIGDDARRTLTLADGITLQVHKDQQADSRELAGVLQTARHEEWTGVLFPPEVPYEWLDLWLCVRLPVPLMRMNVTPHSRDTSLVTPMFGWGSMATADGSHLAYLTTRPAPPAPDGGRLYEIGVIGHGPGGPAIATRTAQEIRTWDSHYRGLNVRFELPDHPRPSDPACGRYLLSRPARPITVTWY